MTYGFNLAYFPTLVLVTKILWRYFKLHLAKQILFPFQFDHLTPPTPLGCTLLKGNVSQQIQAFIQNE